jgi:polyphosphate kinase
MAKKEVLMVNRDISWLSFNHRVLQEAADANVPLIERLKFLGICSNNLDEFFRVRVGTYNRMLGFGRQAKYHIGVSPVKILDQIQSIVLRQQSTFEKVYKDILEELEKNHIHLLNEKQISKEQGQFVRKYFRESVRPLLVPIMIQSVPNFPYLRDNAIYLAVNLSQKRNKANFNYALIEVPTEVPRFFTLPKIGRETYVILLDDVIRYCLEEIFSVFEFDKFEAFTIKLTRDAELGIDSDLSKTLTEKIVRGLKLRKVGNPVRLVYDQKIPADLLSFIIRKMKLGKHQALIPGGRYHNFRDFMKFPSFGNESFLYPPIAPLPHPKLAGSNSIFSELTKQEILLCYPYQSYDYIIDFLREAAIDPRVVSIRITLYRAARQSKIINALVNALRNGKQVTAIVELQARFDEQANMNLATLLHDEGARVIYGVPGLKVHSKLILVTRKEGRQMVNYAHIGTGNFNEDTAKVYSDFSFLTCDSRITAELEKVFHFYKNNFKIGTYKHLLVCPFFMRNRIIKMISDEVKNAKAGKKAEIILKLNSLVDEELIEKLYAASSEGVKIRLIIRGICSLVPGIKGLSENIEAISLVDKYLEHARVLAFYNGGDWKIYLSSADLMIRNLDFRSEIAVPIYDRDLQKMILDFLNIQWNGSTKVRILNASQDNVYRLPDGGKKTRAQDELYKYFEAFLQHKK